VEKQEDKKDESAAVIAPERDAQQSAPKIPRIPAEPRTTVTSQQ
jgi:hypothetical protein